MLRSAQNDAVAEVVSYLSLGSNIGDRIANLSRAISELRALGSITAISSLYETEPMEVKDQPWFLNCAIALATHIPAGELLHATLKIEEEMGRRRLVPKGPRTVDIDILLYADQVISTPELTIPHPSMHARRFVLAPLTEIAGELRHPLLKCSIRALMDGLLAEAGVVRRLDNHAWPPEI